MIVHAIILVLHHKHTELVYIHSIVYIGSISTSAITLLGDIAAGQKA